MVRVSRSNAFAACCLTMLLSSLLYSPPATAAEARFDVSSFERNLQGWRRDHFVECEEDSSCAPALKWRIDRARGRAFHGKNALKGSINRADGIVWVEKRFSLPPGSRVSAVVSVWLRPSRRSDSKVPVVAYLGSSNPEDREEFTIVAPAQDRRGWTRYEYRTPLTVNRSGKVWAAFGFGAEGQRSRTNYLDFAVVRFRPA